MSIVKRTKAITVMNKISYWLCLLCLVLISGQTFAQSEAATSTEEKTNNTEEQQSQHEAKQEENEQTPITPPVASSNSESFVPSEEISEDLSVSFPVDI